MSKIYTAFIIALGAVIYRVRGGLVPAFPRPVDQMLFALPYGAIAYKLSGRNAWWFCAVLCLTTLAITTGHGQYMDLGTYNDVVSPERFDFIVYWIFGQDTFVEFWRDAFGLAVTGLVVTLPCSLCLLYHKKYLLSVFLFLSGALKFPAYWIGWTFFSGTEMGEFLTGGFLWASAILVYKKV